MIGVGNGMPDVISIAAPSRGDSRTLVSDSCPSVIIERPTSRGRHREAEDECHMEPADDNDICGFAVEPVSFIAVSCAIERSYAALVSACRIARLPSAVIVTSMKTLNFVLPCLRIRGQRVPYSGEAERPISRCRHREACMRILAKNFSFRAQHWLWRADCASVVTAFRSDSNFYENTHLCGAMPENSWTLRSLFKRS